MASECIILKRMRLLVGNKLGHFSRKNSTLLRHKLDAGKMGVGHLGTNSSTPCPDTGILLNIGLSRWRVKTSISLIQDFEVQLTRYISVAANISLKSMCNLICVLSVMYQCFLLSMKNFSLLTPANPYWSTVWRHKKWPIPHCEQNPYHWSEKSFHHLANYFMCLRRVNSFLRYSWE